MRLLALILAVTVTGPQVTSLVCDLACAAKHQVVAAQGSGCHEHGTDASTPKIARGPQCHDLSAAPESLVTGGPDVIGALPHTPSGRELSAQPRDRSTDLFSDPPHAPPPILVSLRI